MKYISLFTGIGCADVAWVPLGWEPLVFSEVDPFASAVLARRFPNVPNVGDVTTHDWSAYRGKCDLLIGGSPCFAAGTLVLTSEGLRPIETVKSGDMVLTHNHRYRRVIRTGGRVAPVGWLKGQGNPGTVTTADHPYRAMSMRMEWRGKAVGKKRSFGEPEWIAARSLPGNFWTMPASHPASAIPPVVPEGNEKVDFTLNEDFFWFIGAYLGDGWVRFQGNRRGSVIICDGKHHGNKIAEIAARCGLHCLVVSQKTVNRFQVSSKALAKWIDLHFGHGAADKSLPAWVYGLEPSFRRALFAGYQWADGHELGDTIKTTSIGRKLSLSMRLLGASLGLRVSTTVNVPTRKDCVIEGRTVNERPFHVNSYNMASRSAFFRDGDLWMKVKRFEPLNIEIPVYNLEVEEDNSYTADGFFVHNCQAFSVAGLRKSLSDSRGNLTLAFVEACNAIRPGIVVWENVPGVQSTGDNAFGCFLAGMVGAAEPLHSGHRRGRWPDAGMVVGPQRAAAWGLLDAQYFGVPQRRKRLFLVAVALSHPSFAPGKVPNPAAILFEPPGLFGDSTPGGEAREEIVGTLGSRASAGGGLGTDLECAGGLQPVMDGLPAVSGTLGGGSGDRGYPNSPDVCGCFVPMASGAIEAHGGGEVVPAVTAKWAKGCGGPVGDETQNLVAFHATQDPTHYSHITPALGCGSTNGQATVAVALADDTPPDGVAVPLLEVGKRTGTSGARHGAGIGIGNDGDPMYTLQASAKHGVVCTEEAVPLDLRNAQRDRRPDTRAPGGGMSGQEGDPAFTVTAGFGPQAVAFSSKDSGADEGEVAPTLRAMGHDASHANGGGQVAVAVRMAQTSANGCGVSENLAHTLDASGPEAVAYQDDGITVGGNVAHTLRAEGADASEDGTGRGTPVVAVHQNQSGELRTGAIANTLNTNGNATGRNSPLVATGLTVRRLTPRECERLQGLPDDWTLIPYGRARNAKDLAEMAAYWAVTEEVAKTLAADSLRYKATGNGMAVPVIWWLGKRIEWVLAELAAWDGLFDDD